jgi:NADH-quinone oxidoreductase subunit H
MQGVCMAALSIDRTKDMQSSVLSPLWREGQGAENLVQACRGGKNTGQSNPIGMTDMRMNYLLGLIVLFIKIAVMLGGLLLVASYLVWLERKLLARLQIRLGPNRAGIFGLLQPIADAIKLLTKEDIVPAAADAVIFRLAPAVVAVTAMLMFAVVPWGRTLTCVSAAQVPMVITDLNVGLLFVFALSSLGVYGVALGGWASNSKFSLLGGIRGAAQMISYELALGLSLVPVVMLAGILQPGGHRRCPGRRALHRAPAGLVRHFRNQRHGREQAHPFDLPEAENELGAGFHTEYSGMRFGLFFLGEYVHIQVLGALTAVFFLGGWHGPLAAAGGLADAENIHGGRDHDLDPRHPAAAALRSAHGPGLESTDSGIVD